jgi:hypothetical protein
MELSDSNLTQRRGGLFKQHRGLADSLSDQRPGFSSEDGLQLAQKLSK